MRIDDLNARQLSDLLHLVCAEDPDCSDLEEASRAGFLAECLSRPFVHGQFQEPLLEGIPKLLQKSYVLTPGQCLADLLFNHKASLSEVKIAKNFFGSQSKQESDKIKQDVCIVLYYAFIAAGLVHHSQKITEYSTADLNRYLERLAKKTWIPDEICGLFRGALDRLTEMQQ